jgi:hypothetical protein
MTSGRLSGWSPWQPAWFQFRFHGEREIITHQLTHGARFGNVAVQIGIALRFVGVKADFDLGGFKL